MPCVTLRNHSPMLISYAVAQLLSCPGSLTEYTLGYPPYPESQDSSVGTAIRPLAEWPKGRGWIAGRGKRFSLLHNVHTGSDIHPVSYKMGTEGCVPGGKTAGAWSWPSSAQGENGGTIPLLPHTSSCRGPKLIKAQECIFLLPFKSGVHFFHLQP
jgi:hypothetical protein